MFDDLKELNSEQEVSITSASSEPKISGETIYVMPERFAPKAKKRKITRKIILIVSVFLIVAVLLGVGILFFKKLWNEASENELKAKETVPKVNKNVNQSAGDNQTASPEQIISEEFKDEDGKIKGTAKLTIPVDSLSSKLSIKITAYPKELYQDFDLNFQILGPVYILEPQTINLSKPASLILTYSQGELLDLKSEGKDLKIGCLKDNKWQILGGEIDETNKNVSVSLDKLESYIYAIIFPSEEKQGLSLNEMPLGSDSDSDGLTDEEEKLYRTDFKDPDTDGDSYSDKEEIINLYSPVLKGGKLETSGLTNLFTNPVFKYSLFYPANWVAQALDAANNTLIFTSATGEFIEVLVLENPKQLTILEWYEEQISPQKDSILEKVKETAIAGQKGIEIPDLEGQRIVYFSSRDRIYGLIYNYGDKVELNFKTTFEMMKNSFKLE